MAIIKLLHVICVFIWIGNLLCLTRLMGYRVKEDAVTQAGLARILKRMYSFISLPSMCLALLFGFILLPSIDLRDAGGWFHMKLTMAFGLIVCDIATGRAIAAFSEEPETGRGVKYKILHGVAGLLLIALLSSTFLVRNKEKELHRKWQKELTLQQNSLKS